MKFKLSLLLAILIIPTILWAAFTGISGFMDMGTQGIKAGFIIMPNGSDPDATSDGLVYFGAQDASGDTKSAFSFYQEQDVSADATEASFDACWIVTINGVRRCVMTFAAP